MEPVTHVLTGACLARTGLNRRAVYTTLAMAIAAEFPDVDTVWSLRGPVSGFQHHRGLTHTFLALPFEAALLLLGVVLFHRVRIHRRRTQTAVGQRGGTLTGAPVRWGALYLFILLALGSHLLLDYTNNYGLRPFFPFQTRWYAGSIAFIFDPLIFLLLLAGLLLPSLFGLVSREIGARPPTFQGANWARIALTSIALILCLRTYEHRQAVMLAATQTMHAPADPLPELPSEATPEGLAANEQGASEPPSRLLAPQRVLASPDPLSPFRWYTVADFGSSYQLGTADTRLRLFYPDRVLTKPDPGPALAAAARSRLGQIYLDWSQMPLLTLSTADPEASGTSGQRLVYLQDLRFAGATPLLHRGGKTPLTGEVILGSQGGVLAEGMDGRFGR